MECRNNKHFSERNRPTGFAFRDLRSFVIRFDFESYVRFEIRFERKKNDSQVPICIAFEVMFLISSVCCIIFTDFSILFGRRSLAPWIFYLQFIVFPNAFSLLMTRWHCIYVAYLLYTACYFMASGLLSSTVTF